MMLSDRRRETERPFITIIDELNKFIPNSEKFMSSYGKYHLNNNTED